MKKHLVLLVIMLWPYLVYAYYTDQIHGEVTTCTTSINGEFKLLTYFESDKGLSENYKLRELLFKGWGDITCPSFITLKYLTPDINSSERSVFCLQYDKNTKTYNGFDVGSRDAYLNCTVPSKSVCERVNDSKDAAIAITGLGAGAVGGASVAAGAAGVAAVTHSSGAVILTGAGGYIAGTLGSIGATALATLTAPVTVTAAVVSVAAVGGAVYLCREKDDKN